MHTQKHTHTHTRTRVHAHIQEAEMLLWCRTVANFLYRNGDTFQETPSHTYTYAHIHMYTNTLYCNSLVRLTLLLLHYRRSATVLKYLVT